MFYLLIQPQSPFVYDDLIKWISQSQHEYQILTLALTIKNL